MAYRPRLDPWYAIRERIGPCGTAYLVRLTRKGALHTKRFRERDFGTASAALRAARAWRDDVARVHTPETKQAFSGRSFPHNTSGCPGVYLKRQVIVRRGKQYEYLHWQAQSPAGAKPWRSRSFSVDRYGYDDAYLLAVDARAELVALVRGYVGVTQIPKRFRPKT
jgi:hypothetical protein